MYGKVFYVLIMDWDSMKEKYRDSYKNTFVKKVKRKAAAVDSSGHKK